MRFAMTEDEAKAHVARPGDVAIKLTTDLTRYHPGLQVGACGVGSPLEPKGMWARQQDRFLSVNFGPAIGWHDVLWGGVEVVHRWDNS